MQRYRPSSASPPTPEPPDIADALAIALCASRRAAWAEDTPPELPDDDHDTD